MYIYNQLVTDEICSTKKNSIIRKIRMNAGQINVYVISLSGGKDNFDIFSVANLKQKSYPKNDLYIMGFAGSMESAIELSTELYLQFLKEYQTIDFKDELLLNKEQLFRRK